jgi:hypothetical protein
MVEELFQQAHLVSTKLPKSCFHAAYEPQTHYAPTLGLIVADAHRWDEKAGLRRDAVRSQGIDVLESTDQSKETGNEEG